MKRALLHGLCAAAMVTVALSANAECINLGELEAGKNYVYGPNTAGGYEATYTVPAGATEVVISYASSTGQLDPFSDAEHSNAINSADRFNFDNSTGRMTISKCTPGEVLYLYNNFVFDGLDFTIIKEKTPVELLEVYPEAGTMLSEAYSNHYQVDLKFSEAVKANPQASVTLNGTTLKISLEQPGSNYLRVPMKTTLQSFYNAGTVNKGDEMTILLTNVRNADNAEMMCNGDGRVELKFTVYDPASRATEIKNVSDPFLSYYVPGDPNGIATFTFDAPLMSKEDGQTVDVSIQVGDLAYDDRSQYEQMDYTIDGNSLIVDFTGKLREWEPYLQWDDNNKMVFQVKALKSASGQFVYCDSPNATGYFGYALAFTTVRAKLACDFTPFQNTAIGAGDEMEFYISGYKNITFDGVDFNYLALGGEQKTVTVPMAEMRIEPDALDKEAESLFFAVPEMPGIVKDSKITVSLNNLVSFDGYDHSSEMQGTFTSREGVESGVEDTLAADDTLADVYALDGTLVLRSVRIADMPSMLPAGVYVAAGRKIIVK